MKLSFCKVPGSCWHFITTPVLKKNEGAILCAISRGRAPPVSFLCWCFQIPVGVGPLRFSPISARAYTRSDVPREFYPRRSANSTHFPHLPDMRHLRGEGPEKNTHDTAVDLYTLLCLESSGFDTEATFHRGAEAETDNNRL